MKNQISSPFLIFLKRSQPLALLSGVLMYALGGGMVHYLGHPINWTGYWLGQGCVTLLQLASFYLKAYYDPADPVNDKTTLPRLIYLQASITVLTVGAVLTVLLYTQKLINLSALLILGITFILSFFYAVPPLRLVDRGYDELVNTFMMADLVPALCYLLQTGELHRMIGLVTFPVTALYLTMLLALSLPGYASDLKYKRKTLMIMLGWQRGMLMHNLLILLAYLLLGFALLMGLPLALIGPGFFTLPIGLFQIWLMNQIASGVKPRWRLLTLTSVACWGLTAYLLSFTLWTR